jgi:predicted ATPase
MIRRVEARSYKLLKRIDVQLENLNILVGPNASGKSTLIDIFAFLQTALSDNVETAVRTRTMGNSLDSLVWKQEDVEQGFDFAVELTVPEGFRSNYDSARYELQIGHNESGSLAIKRENLFLIIRQPVPDTQLGSSEPVVHSGRTPSGYRKIISKVADDGNSNFRSESTGWNTAFRLPPLRLSLSGLPEDEARFPISLWVKNFLLNSIQILQLNSVLMRRPTPSDAKRTFQVDGSNLPIVVQELSRNNSERFGWWIDHLKTILPDLEGVSVAERPEDRSLYLKVIYRGDLHVPAWLLSDGTLRLLALTLLAYLPNNNDVFLIEEPENGVHPKAIEAIFTSLSSVYNGQVFLATHSPLLLSLAQPEQLLIFSKTEEGASEIIRGSEHPMLRNWQRDISLGTLLASGVLD